MPGHIGELQANDEFLRALVEQSADNIVDDESPLVVERNAAPEGLTPPRRAREEAVEHARQLELVSDLAIELAEVPPDADFFAIVADRLRAIADAVAVSVSIFDAPSSCLILRHLSLADASLAERVDEILGGSAVGMRVVVMPGMRQRMLARSLVRTTSVGDLTYGAISEETSRRLASTLNLGECIGAGLRYAGEPVGSIAFFMPRDRPSPSETMVEALARVVTGALRRHLAERETLRLNRALRTTSECNQTLVRATDERDLVKEICRTVVEIGGYRLAWIGFVGPDSPDEIRPVAHHGHEAGYLRAYSRSFAEAPPAALRVRAILRAGRPVIVRDVASDDLYAPWREEAIARGYRSAIFFPLTIDGEWRGVLAIYDDEPNGFDADEVALLSELAGDVSYGLHTLRLREAHRRTREVILRSSADLTMAYDSTLEGWSRALELRERETAGHSQRVVDLTVRIARALGLPEDEVVHIRRGALLHDIGKMGVPDSILLKPGPLDEEEWRVMRRHPEYSRQLLADIAYLERAIEIPYCHHERWDGGGYPNGLLGEEIPLAARIFAVVDVWDALTCDRPYRRAWSEDRAAAYLVENAGKHFDPAVVETFLKLRGKSEGRWAGWTG